MTKGFIFIVERDVRRNFVAPETKNSNTSIDAPCCRKGFHRQSVKSRQLTKTRPYDAVVQEKENRRTYSFGGVVIPSHMEAMRDTYKQGARRKPI